MRLLSRLVFLLIVLLATPAQAIDFPKLTGRVVDAANVLPADQEARLEQKLAALEQQSGRQLVIATIPDLQGNEISDYGYQLGRAWGIGSKGKNDGAILIVAPNERKVRIEVGYGLEGTITDAISFLIISQQILPRFKANDIPGGVEAGADALIKQMTLPADQAQQAAARAAAQADAAQADAAQARARSGGSGGGFPMGLIVPMLLVGLIFLMFIRPMLRGGGGRRSGSFGGGLGPLILWDALNSGRGGGGFGGDGFGGGGGGGGGFSGGGGSFGGGGSSGSW